MAEREPTLVPGIERRDEFTVEGRLITSVDGTIGASVLSTPGMIGIKLRFDVEVTEGERTIGVGTHERRVVDFGQLASPAS